MMLHLKTQAILAVGVCAFAILMAASVYSSGGNVTPHDVQTRAGGTFTVRIEVESERNGNYSVFLGNTTHFTNLGPANRTMYIPSGDTVTYEFEMRAKKGISEGYYSINYVVYMEGVEMEHGKVSVYVTGSRGDVCAASLLPLLGMGGIFSTTALIFQPWRRCKHVSSGFTGKCNAAWH